MRLLRLSLVGLVGLAAAGVAAAASFAVSAPEPRRSIKVERITPEMMMEICAFERQDAPFFLDNEYRRAILEIETRRVDLPPGSPQARGAESLSLTLKECRENDLNKRSAQRAMRSCKALVREHRAASERAEGFLESSTDNTLRGEILSWGERFRAPLEKCLQSMRCRVDNKKDEQEALEVYREIVDVMQGWLLDVKDVEKMKICGSTLRDVRNWCEVKSHPDADNSVTVRDDCKTPHELMLTINLLQNIRIRKFPQSTPGGLVPVGAPR